MQSAGLPAHGPGCRPLAGSRSARFPDEQQYVCTARCPRRTALAREYDTARANSKPGPLVLVTFKDEGADRHGRPFGAVHLIRVEHPAPEAAAAAAAGVPFAYEPDDVTDLGWRSQDEASAIAAEHGVALTFR